MKAGKIFLVGEGKNELVPMVETYYEKEDVLQVMLEKYPDLLPGDQINPESPRRWLLVNREVGIPAEKMGGDIWSIDHLFLDQDGIPTFVECKRSSDTRSRREVVAQMLDYAANGTEYWAIERLIQSTTETATKNGKSLDEELKRLLDVDDDNEFVAYWNLVKNNLKEGKVRLVFVSDETPKELRRLVEFLNSKMTDVEVLAVEIKQFIGNGDKKAVVPRLIGMTESVRKTNPTKTYIARDDFISNNNGLSEYFESLFIRIENEGYSFSYTQENLSIRTVFKSDKKTHTLAYFKPDGQFNFYFGFPCTEKEEAEIRKALLDMGIFKPTGKCTLRARLENKSFEKINEAWDYIFDRMKQMNASNYLE